MAAIATTNKTDQPNSTGLPRVTQEPCDPQKAQTRNKRAERTLTLRLILQGLETADMGDLLRTAKRVACSWDGAHRNSLVILVRWHWDLDVVVCSLQQVQWDGVPHEPSPTTFLKTIEIKVLQPTPCHGERVASTARSSTLGKANEICRFQPSKLKGPGTSTSFCTGASASSLTLPSSPSSPSSPLLSSQQVQWDGVDARLRHQEGVPRTHGTRQHEPEIRGFQPTSCHGHAGSPKRPPQLGLCPRKLALSRKATGRFGIAPAETRGEAAHGTAGSHVNLSTHARGICATNTLAIHCFSTQFHKL